MKKGIYLLLFTIFLFCFSSVYAQQNDLLAPGEYGSVNYNCVLNTGTNGGYVAVVPGTTDSPFFGSLEAWIYPTSTANATPMIVSKGDAGTGYYFGWTASTKLLFLKIGSITTQNTGGTLVPLNTWSHIAVTWTHSSNYTVTFYVNGAISGTAATNTGTMSSSADSLIIGSTRAVVFNKDFIGYIDEVRIWGATRTEAQIRDNRFVGLGDGNEVNTGFNLITAASYSGLSHSWTFNTGSFAYDDIGGKTGYCRKGALIYWASPINNPIPYNFALQRDAALITATSYVEVTHNAAFFVSTGTVEMWYYPTDITTPQVLIGKGSTTNVSFCFGLASTDLLSLRFGNTAVTNDGGIHIPSYKWSHIAATWTGSAGNYTVKFYVNGVQSGLETVNTGTWNYTTDPLTIGNSLAFSGGGLLGYIDEVRYWNTARTATQIKNYMFASCRGFSTDASLIGAWNFDGNLNNFSSTTGINGSFNTGGTNNCRLSGYVNETTAGAPDSTFIAHTTVLNKGASPNPFPTGYNMKLSNKYIGLSSTVLDTLSFAASRVITSVELFLSLQHGNVGFLIITLKAPNGTTKTVKAYGTGGPGDNILTFFSDGQPLCSTTGFYAPWSPNAGPVDAFGNFGGTDMHGNWILSIVNNSGLAGYSGTLLGWGLRFNGDNNTAITPSTTSIPDKFELFQNYPNPFNPVTTIKYNLVSGSNVKITVFDILGREVSTLVNQYQTAGSYKVDFDAHLGGSSTSEISSGVYFYKIEAGQFTDVKRMNLIK